MGTLRPYLAGVRKRPCRDGRPALSYRVDLAVNRLSVVEEEIGQVHRLLVVDVPQPGWQCCSMGSTSRFRGRDFVVF
jgi:hypothetical protein